MSSSFQSLDLLLAIPPEERSARAHAGVVVGILPVPRGGAGVASVMRLVSASVNSTINRLAYPNSRALEIQGACSELARCLTELERSAAVHRPLLTPHERPTDPLWRHLLKLAEDRKAQLAAQLLIGCAYMLAVNKNKPLASSTTGHLKDLSRLKLSTEDLDSLVLGYTPDTYLPENAISRLTGYWRETVRTFSLGDPPPPDFSDRVRGQLLGTALNPTAAHAAGALDHRQMTDRQLTQICHMLQHEMTHGTLLGVLGVLCLRTGLDVELLTVTPLAPATGWTSHCLELNPRAGTLKLDLRSLVHDAARPLQGCQPAAHELHIHLPSAISASLCSRSQENSSATCLMDLYRDEPIPDPNLVLLPNSPDGIAVTWSRLRQTLGPWLLRYGKNALIASLLSLDFSLICRSKLYYTMVSAADLRAAEVHLYQQLGLEPEPGTGELAKLTTEIGFGSQVVPTLESLRKHDRLLLQSVLDTRPGPNSSVESLIKHHNAFTLLTAWRVTLLLAMRSTTSVDLSSEIHAGDVWIGIDDKSTSNATGHQPVPFCSYASTSIDLYSSHCSALARRLSRMASPDQKALMGVARYASLIGRRRNAKLFWMISKRHRVMPVSSAQLTKSLDSDYQLPADVGRKVLENHLRSKGLPSTLIDMTLRHNHSGQIHLSAFSHRDLRTSMKRLSSAIDGIARDLFGEPTAGLSKGKS